MGVKQKIRKAKALAYSKKTLRNRKHAKADKFFDAGIPGWRPEVSAKENYKNLRLKLDPNAKPTEKDPQNVAEEASTLQVWPNLQTPKTKPNRKTRFVLSTQDCNILRDLVAKHGRDVAAMHADRKLNFMLWSPSELRKKLSYFSGSSLR